MRVLAEIKGIELAEAAEFRLLAHWMRPPFGTYLPRPASTQSRRSLWKCFAATGTPDAGNSIKYSSAASNFGHLAPPAESGSLVLANRAQYLLAAMATALPS